MTTSIEAQRSEAQARLQASQTTYERLRAASATPGVVAGNDVEVAENNVAGDRARVLSLENSLKSAQAAVKVFEELFSYLRLTAPFDGVVTERSTHPGAFVGPSAGPNNPPIVRIEQNSRLRLVVPVPEAQIAAITMGARVPFTVPAYPNETFRGIVRRSAQSLDLKTRTMLVELDVDNNNRRLSPGAAAMDAEAPFHAAKTTRERALAYMDFYISLFDDPSLLKSCLAGTTVQEVADTNPALRDAANVCFMNGAHRFQALLDDACRDAGKRADTASLADFWVATIQGSLILFKSSQNEAVIRRNLNHAKTYIAGHLPPARVKAAKRGAKR